MESNVTFQNPTFPVGTGSNEAYGMFTGENPYYYISAPGQTNSMIPLTGQGFHSQAPQKLPPRPCDEQMDTIKLPAEHDTVSMDSYIEIVPDTDNQTEATDQNRDKIGMDTLKLPAEHDTASMDSYI